MAKKISLSDFNKYMSMGSYIVGFCKPDEQFQKMVAVYNACKEAHVDLPEEVSDFFDDTEPDASGMEIDIRDSVEEWSGDMSEGFEIDISKLPKNVKYIRFYNSY